MSVVTEEKVLIGGVEIPSKLIPILDAPWERPLTVKEVLESCLGAPDFQLMVDAFIRRLDSGEFSGYLRGRK